MSVNKVILLGRVGKDPEVKTINGDLKVANFSIATSEKYKDRDGNRQEKTTWHNCQAWRGLAGIIEQYVKKGDLIYVEGKISNRSYEKDGVTKYVTEIVVDQMTMCGGKKNDGERDDRDDRGREDDLPF